MSTSSSDSTSLESKKTGTPKTATPEAATCCGREIKPCLCINHKCLFTATLVIGAILLIFAILALVAYFTTNNPLHTSFNFAAEAMGTDPFLLAMFTTGLGVAFTLGGSVGLIVDCTTPPPRSKS